MSASPERTFPPPRRCLAATLALLAIPALRSLSACTCGEMPPIDDSFDGNIVIGDARPRSDASRRAEDAEARDSRPPNPDGSGRDASARDADADAIEADAGDASTDCLEPASATFTATQAIDMAAALAGRVVGVTGTAVSSALVCTGEACPDASTCCQRCTSTVSIDGLLELLGGDCSSTSPGCAGDECAQLCHPPLLGVPQTFRGRIVDALPDGGVGLVLYSVAP